MQAFDVLADPVRRRIVKLIATAERTSGDIASLVQPEFEISQSAVSQHLRVLRESGVAQVRRDGTRRCYSLQRGAFKEVEDWLEDLKTLWVPALEALATEVERGRRKR